MQKSFASPLPMCPPKCASCAPLNLLWEGGESSLSQLEIVALAGLFGWMPPMNYILPPVYPLLPCHIAFHFKFPIAGALRQRPIFVERRG